MHNAKKMRTRGITGPRKTALDAKLWSMARGSPATAAANETAQRTRLISISIREKWQKEMAWVRFEKKTIGRRLNAGVFIDFISTDIVQKTSLCRIQPLVVLLLFKVTFDRSDV